MQEYHDLLKKGNPAAFKKQFSRRETALGSKSSESLYKAAHADIRKDPSRRRLLALKHPPARRSKPALLLSLRTARARIGSDRRRSTKRCASTESTPRLRRLPPNCERLPSLNFESKK